MKVTKLDAAICQLMTALELFIEDKDPVSINTLASNALEIIETLGEKSNVPIFINYIEESHPHLTKTDIRRIRNKERNYAKHADRDFEDHMEYSNANNVHLILSTTHDLGNLTKSLPIELQVFEIWYSALYDEPSSAEMLFPISLKTLSEPKQRELLKYTIYNIKQYPELMTDAKTMIWPRQEKQEALETT